MAALSKDGKTTRNMQPLFCCAFFFIDQNWHRSAPDLRQWKLKLCFSAGTWRKSLGTGELVAAILEACNNKPGGEEGRPGWNLMPFLLLDHRELRVLRSWGNNPEG